jgi:hypothetical protein
VCLERTEWWHPMFRNQEFYPAAAVVIWAASICVVILYYG